MKIKTTSRLKNEDNFKNEDDISEKMTQQAGLEVSHSRNDELNFRVRNKFGSKDFLFNHILYGAGGKSTCVHHLCLIALKLT